MRQLAVVAAGLTLAGILIAVTAGVFMEINVGGLTWHYSSHAVAATVSRLQSEQQAKLANAAALEATAQPQFVTIKQSVAVGTDVLPSGTQLEFIAKHDPDVWVRYKGGEYAIPISATNLK
jgi:trehalose-6-phosphatase